jgi:hypothetical protein
MPMTRRSIALLSWVLVTALVVLFPGLALAKGASEATITGPGLDGPISLAGEGRPGGEQLMQIAESAGFFQAVFGQAPDPMLSEEPEGTLGPRYTITYVMPGPNNELDRLRQDVYPYATPNPLTYTAPDQPFWTTERTRGGWYVASSSFRDQLVAVGLPDNPTIGAADDGTPWTTVGALAAALALLGIVIAVVFRRGRGRASGAPAAG